MITITVTIIITTTIATTTIIIMMMMIIIIIIIIIKQPDKSQLMDTSVISKMTVLKNALITCGFSL